MNILNPPPQPLSNIVVSLTSSSSPNEGRSSNNTLHSRRLHWLQTMTSYQQQHQQTSGRRTDNYVLHDGRSVDSSWIITELARATNENVFSDTVSSPLSVTRQSASPDSELWAEQVNTDFDHVSEQALALCSPYFNDPVSDS